jgi:alpha-L-rhamnosidase
MFRKVFRLGKQIKKGTVYVSGLGYYELYLNGKKAGDRVLEPAFTRYDRRVLYAGYDVTEQIKEGDNAVGVILGNGWYNMHTRAVWDFDKAPWRDWPVMICQLEVEYVDGTREVIASDSSWKVATGPIVFESIRNGETYDARLEMTGWDTAGFDEMGWNSVEVIEGPKGVLSAQMMPPIKVMKTVKPVKVTEPTPGCFIFDMGQNMAGWAQLKLSGPAGTRVVMKYGERLNPDGTLDQKDISVYVKQGEFQTDTYIMKGEGVEVWESRFTYHGFQYVQVTGFAGKLTDENLRGRVVHTSFDRAGSFACSNTLLNQMQQNILWSFVSNYHGYPTDCPHREKNGWTGDAHITAEQALYNFDMASSFTKWINDLKDEQRDSGELPGIVPTGGWGYDWGNGPAWDSAYLLIPWYLYQYRGDERILREHYDRFKRYVDYLTSKAENHIVSFGLGDWMPVQERTPEKVLTTGYYYCDTLLVAGIAKILGKTEDTQKYGELARAIKEAFNQAFFDSATGQYAGGTQTGLSCALYQGFVEPDQRVRVVQNLVENVARHEGHLDTGFPGTKYLIHVLTENNRSDLVYQMATQKTYPSWGYWIEQGATTMWESWDGTGSLNHFAFGSIGAWFYQAIAGIRLDPEKVGFKHIIIQPLLLGDLSWAKAEHESMYGTISSSWKMDRDRFELEVTIPVNSTATVYVPAQSEKNVALEGKSVEEVKEVQFLRMENQRAVFRVESGKYMFRSKNDR